jgi:YHS domain-containing protein
MAKRNDKKRQKSENRRLLRLEREVRRVLFIGIFVLLSLGSTYMYFRVRHLSRVRQISAEKVCMLDDWTLDSALFPAEVAGKTYYCCFEKCGEKLQANPELRFAVDPISGVKLDKADAVYGVSRDGKGYYFETLENLEMFHADLE